MYILDEVAIVPVDSGFPAWCSSTPSLQQNAEAPEVAEAAEKTEEPHAKKSEAVIDKT